MGPDALAGRRDTALEQLGDHYARGRLSTGTLERRVGAALQAESRGELRGAVADLPPGGWRERADRALDAVLGPTAVWLSDAVTLVLSSEQPRRAWVVGRSRSCDLTVGEATVSACHARFVRRGSRWSVCDLGSTNGTWVNGHRVATAVLRPGDVLHLGALAGRVTR